MRGNDGDPERTLTSRIDQVERVALASAINSKHYVQVDG